MFSSKNGSEPGTLAEAGEDALREIAYILSEGIEPFDGASPEDFEILLRSTDRTTQRVYAVFDRNRTILGAAVWRVYDFFSGGAIEANLAWMVVRSGMRSHGIGTWLLQQSLEEFLLAFPGRRVKRVIVECEKANKRALTFHRRVLCPSGEAERDGRVYFHTSPERIRQRIPA